MVPTFVFLFLAVVSLWVELLHVRRPLWLILLFAGAGAGLVYGIVTWVGLLWLAMLGVAAWAWNSRPEQDWARTIGCLAVAAIGGGLLAHAWPGFNNPKVIDGARLSADTIPYRLFLNFDKTAAGLLLLAFWPMKVRRRDEWVAMVRGAWPVMGVTLAVIMVASLWLGYVRWDPKFPAWAWLWLLVNSLSTCVAEESFFRGFLQTELQRVFRSLPGGRWLALFLAALAFGGAHAAGGMTYVALATVAGLGYGLAYQRTNRLEAGIVLHFLLNSVHFFLFSYPALQR